MEEDWDWVKPGWENLVGFIIVIWVLGLLGLVPDLRYAIIFAIAYVVGSIIVILFTIWQIKQEKSNDSS